MFRRLGVEYAISILFRVIVFAFLFLLFSVAVVTFVPLFWEHQLPSQTKWVVILALAFMGGVLGFLLGLFKDIRVFLTLIWVKQISTKFFTGVDTFAINHYVQSSKDRTRQIRLTRDDATFLEHYHFEILDPVQPLILENYVYGKSRKISETIWQYINPSSASRQIAFLETPAVSNPVNHLSCKWSESVETAATKLPPAQILLLTEMSLGVYLFRFSEELYYAGDTWHQTIAEAKSQAIYEFGITDDVWQTVPDDVNNMVEFFADQKRRKSYAKT